MTYLKLGRSALAAATLLFLFSVSSHAALYAVDLDGIAGHDAVYDDVLDITWLADANLAKTNTFGLGGIVASGAGHGTMYWTTAEAYVSAMNADNGGEGYLGVNTWRQPSVAPLNGSYFVTSPVTYDGSTDRSYQLSAPVGVNNLAGRSAGFTGSELAYHYYNNFEAIGECSGVGSTCSFPQPSTVYGIDDAPDPNGYKSLFSNIENDTYWTGTSLNTGNAFRFYASGSQGPDPKNRFNFVWVVAPGNVAASAVPLPASLWLFSSALWALYHLKTRSTKQDQPTIHISK